MQAGNFIPFLELCAIVAGTSFLLIAGVIAMAMFFPPDYEEMLIREHLLNPSLVTIALLAGGAYCGFLVLYIWFLTR